MKKILTIVAFTLVFLMQGCGKDGEPVTVKYDNVVQVFMHTTSYYTIMFQDGKELKSINLQGYGVEGSLHIYNDVTEGSPMWAKVTIQKYLDREPDSFVEIHIHSAKEIGGGDYSSGKGSRGNTIPLER